MLAGTFTIKQAQRFTVPPSTMETYLAADEHQCKKAFEYFMHLLNSKIYKNAYSRYNKSLRVIDVLERYQDGRWHIHFAIEPPEYMSEFKFKMLIDSRTKNIYSVATD